ncbi:RHS repeat-associated core domain-containing protein [Pseudoalteromonas marina]|uniref:RHS repeat-associated core domain-containing protein n=1 Tax=Pseudoalteromonas marina TaxID=267375 RepID=UPI0023EFE37F|nr:RHS repeat-associated core domain-containing protein [Pseudoalteromonas marina]
MASSSWVPIANDGITTFIPIPKVTVNGVGVYTTGDSTRISIGDIGATTAYYFRTKDVNSGALGPLQCKTAEQVKNDGNSILADPGINTGKYTYQVSACMTGSGCDINAFESGSLACSIPGATNQFEYKSVAGTRAISVSDSATEHVGTIAAQFRVSESGAATYNVPISIPKGTAGVAPQVSLNYSSQAGDGIVGQGWSLSASSAVTRCGKTPVYDGKQGGVSLTKNDRLCFNGQRLLKNRTANTKHTSDIGITDTSYWSESSVYHTAVDSFNIIKPHYVAGALRAFTVENKAGEIHYYGDVSAISSNKKSLLDKSFSKAFKTVSGSVVSGQSDAFIHSESNASIARMWLIKAVQDVKSNYFVYNYNDFYGNYSEHYGESYLKSIDYTGNSAFSKAPYASIIFNYEESKKQKSGYSAGSPIFQSKLLKNIQVKIDQDLFREYTLSYYESDFQDEKNYLESMTECAGTGTNKLCNAPLTFNWQKPAPITTQLKDECHTEDSAPSYRTVCTKVPVSDAFKPFSTTSSKTVSTKNNNKALMFDFNGDGYSDIIYPDGTWKVKYGPSLSSATTLSGTGNLVSKAEYARVIDFDGDGILDFIVAENKTSNWRVVSSKPTVTKTTHCRGFSECFTINATINVQDTGILASGLEGFTQIIDVDGDSLQDIVTVSGGLTLKYYKNNGSGNFSDSETLTTIPSPARTGPPSDLVKITHTLYNGDSIYKSSAGARNATVLDFNGDGITDLLVGRKTTTRTCTSGGQFPRNIDSYQTSSAQTTSINGQTCSVHSSTSWYLYSGDDWSTYKYEFSGNAFNSPKAVDLNGDGLTDILWRVGDELRYRLSDGTKLLNSNVVEVASTHGSYALKVNDEQERLSYFMDVSGDGRTDLLISNTAKTGRSTYFSMPIKGHPDKIYFQQRGSWTFDENKMTQFADIDGDGKLDWLQGTNSEWKVHLNKDAGKLMNVIANVDNGHGITNNITYSSITNTFNNFPEHNVATYIQDHSSNGVTEDGSLDPDYISPKTGMFMVSRVDSLSNYGTTQSVIYQYGGLLMHKKGYGNLGFELLRTLDLQTCTTETAYKNEIIGYDDDGGSPIWGKRRYSYTNYDTCMATTTVYNQLAPYTGIPKSTVQTLGVGADAVIVSEAINSVANQATVNGGVQAYIQQSTEVSYALNKELTASSVASRSITYNEYDAYGNADKITNKTDNNASGAVSTSNVLTVVTDNTYGSSSVDKKMGRLATTQVSKTLKVGGVTAPVNGSVGSIINNASFTYNSDKLLKTEVTAFGTTTHGYDEWGNKNSSIFVASTPTENDSSSEPSSRSSSTQYDSRGRFMVSTTNTKGFETKTKYKASKSGSSFTQLPKGIILSTQVENYNGAKLTKEYNYFGTPTKTLSSTGSQSPTLQSATYTRLCSSVSCGVAGAFQRIISAASGIPETHTYLDAWGRELVTKKRLLSGSWQVVEKDYDEQGRAKWVSEPGSGSASTYKTTFSYDKLGRVDNELKPTGDNVTREYDGLTTTTIDEKGNKQIVTTNFVGQKVLVKSLSAQGETLTKLAYTYSANNDLLTAKVYKGNTFSHTQVTLVVDEHGRKTSMTDLDKGTWDYTYNDFGELITQTNSSNQTLAMRYDELGRKIARLDVDGLTCWEYDSQLKGALSRVAYKKGANQNTNTCSSNWPTQPNYQETYTYGNNNKLAETETLIDGEIFYSQLMYDEYNRVKYTQYPANGFTVEHGYNNYGMATKLTNVTPNHRDFGKVYQEVKAMDARGNITDVRYANGVKQTKGYKATSGYIDSMSLTKGSSMLHNQSFKFDEVGNLTERKHNFALGGSAHDYCESFGYDSLNRLDWSRTQASTTTCNESSGGIYKNYDYDALGNFKYKQGAGHYTYHSSIKNRVLKVTSGANGAGTVIYDFSNSNSYDNRGNVLSDGSRTFTYSAYDKPTRITKGGIYTDMAYDHNRNLYSRTDKRSNGTTHTLYVKGLYERIKGSNGITEHKYYVGNVVVTDRSNGNNDTFYLHKDHLGSTTSITNASGAVVQHINYDAWGKQNRFSTSSSLQTLLSQQSPAESKGYTGHKELSDLGIIHMGGRIYDATLGRFLQADPHIQAPMNSQSYNRYSYVLNNPMSYTDPSGYFFKALGKFVKKYWKTIVAIAASYVTFGLATGAWSFAAIGNLSAGALIGGGAAAGFVSGAITTGNLRGALQGAFSGALFGAIGGAGLGKFGAFVASGVAGGVMSDLQGGKFGHGFISAGVGAVAGGAFGKAPINRIIGSAVVGGTLSKITGGKFANGALTAAFAAALRADYSSEASGRGKIDFSTEGTSKERQQRFTQVKSGERRVEFKDFYLGTETSADGSKSTVEFTNADEFQSWLADSPAGVRRGWTDAVHTNYLVTDKIVLYRSAVMGFSGTKYLPDGASFTRNFSPIENGHVTLGHEIAHRFGIDTGNNAVSHSTANLHGINRCTFFGLCGGRN